MIHKILNYLFAAVWLVNGLICKVFNIVPRHQEIVGRILGIEHASLFTKIIGILEIVMAVWIISAFKPKLNAVSQVLIIFTMNIIEFLFVPDQLLWGKLNFIFAILFCALIYFNTFILKKKVV